MKINVACSPCFRDESVLDSVSTVIRSCFRGLGLDLHLNVSNADAASNNSRQRSFVFAIVAIEDHESVVLMEKWAMLSELLANFLNTSTPNIILISECAVA